MTPSSFEQQCEDFVRDLNNEMSHRRAEKFKRLNEHKRYVVRQPKHGRFVKWIKSIISRSILF